MPKGTKVYRLAHLLEKKGMAEGPAIATAQKQTGLSYQTGKPPKGKPAPKKKKKPKKTLPWSSQG